MLLILFPLRLVSEIHKLLWYSQHLNILISSLTVQKLQISMGATFLFLIFFLLNFLFLRGYENGNAFA